MNTSDLTIETKNLYLRGITHEFTDDIFREFTPEITIHMFPRPAEKIEETIEFIERSIEENKAGTNLQIMIVNKKTNEFLGCGGVHHIDQPTPELGIWIKKSAHGHGYGKEAIYALKKWADENISYNYLLYPVDRSNHASKRIPESLGGTIGREYDEINLSGDKLHLLEYRIYPPIGN